MEVNIILPKISVIVPVYNVEDFIEESMDSLLNQTIINDIEVLMIDDESKDNSKYLIDKYSLDYDNFHAFHKNNGGPGVARNYGLDNAKGEYIYFMDADDFLVNDALEKLYDFAIENDLEVVTSNFLRFNQNKSWVHPISEFVYNTVDNINKTNLYDNSNLSWDMPLWNKIYKKEFLESNNIRFFDRDVLFEDNLFSNEVYIKANNVGILNEFLYCWRKGSIGSSLTQSYYINRGRDLHEMICLVSELLSENIDDKNVLDKKYLKLLVSDLPYFIEGINNYPKETHNDIFKYVFDMVNLVPDEYFLNLNTYYSTLYEIIKDKSWDDLLLLLKIKKKHPLIPTNLSEVYKNKLDLNKDSQAEKLNISVSKINFDENNLILNINAYLPYYLEDISTNIKFKLTNRNFEDVSLDSEFFNDNVLKIPLNLINNGVNKLIAVYSNENIEKYASVRNGLRKMHTCKKFDFEIQFDKTEDLKIIKREKNHIELIIENIELNNNKFKFEGHSNDKLDTILLKDFLDLNNFEFHIKYISDNYFIFEISYADFLKSPIKKWQITSNNQFGKINVKSKQEFVDERYIINIKNNGNSLICEFKLYNSVDMINKLNKKILTLEHNNNKLKKENKNLKDKINEFKSRKVVKLVDKLKR